MRQRLSVLFLEFFQSERSSGVLLILSTIVSISLANSAIGGAYHDFWYTKIGFSLGPIDLNYDLEHWINDGLMAVFFLLIGLEIEREFYIGELSDLKNARLPIIAAIGGVLTPALIHFLFNRGSETQAGFGIPMATDIAFALGVLSLLGSRIPVALKVFLTAFAIIDDLIAILVIALFYSASISLVYIALAVVIFGVMLILNRRRIHWIPVYLLLGVFMWYAILQSGIHASIAGVLLAFAIPFGDGGENSPSYHLQHRLHKPVAFTIMPIFALANTGIVLGGTSVISLLTSNTLGIFWGLLIGKPLGITLSSILAVRLGVASLPEDVSLRQLIGTGFLGGIGFTMSIFITLLAFGETNLAQNSKIAIMLGSLSAGIVGYILLGRGPVAQKEVL